jgi:cellulose synthase operon protein C
MRLRAHAAIAFVLLCASASQAQRPPRRPVPPLPPPATHEAPALPAPAAEEGGTSLAKRLGIRSAEKLLRSDVSDDRERGLERLGSVRTTRALEVLVRALEPGGGAQSARERLIAVRALSPSAREPEVRLALLRVMSGASGQSAGEAADPLEKQVRETAALALAGSGTVEAVEALGKALRQEGALAEAAALAIEAHPPSDVTPLLTARGAPTPTLARVLGNIGDQRAFHALRDYVKRGSAALRAEAALALTRLGALETVALGRHWSERETEPLLRLTGTRILAGTHDAAAPAAIARLLDDSELGDAALDLALSAPDPALVPSLSGRLPRAGADQLPRLLQAIARAGGPEAARLLSAQLDKPERAELALHALASCAGSDANGALERALGVPATRRVAARAAVLREIALGDSVSGLGRTLESLLGSTAAADRAAAAWGLAALDDRRGAELIESKDPVMVRAAARAALPGTRSALVAAQRLRRETDPATRTALSIALADPAARAHVESSVLKRLIEQGTLEGPLSALTLAIRDEPDHRPELSALLEGGDAVLRAHVVLGLGFSREPSAVGLLEAAYRFEPDAPVRHAIVTALSRRGERTRQRTLALAAGLDSDRATREAALLARRGARLGTSFGSGGTLWLVLDGASSDAGARSWSALIGLPGGLALPMVADPDGFITAGRLPRGAINVRIGRSAG